MTHDKVQQIRNDSWLFGIRLVPTRPPVCPHAPCLALRTERGVCFLARRAARKGSFGRARLWGVWRRGARRPRGGDKVPDATAASYPVAREPRSVPLRSARAHVCVRVCLGRELGMERRGTTCTCIMLRRRYPIPLPARAAQPQHREHGTHRCGYPILGPAARWYAATSTLALTRCLPSFACSIACAISVELSLKQGRSRDLALRGHGQVTNEGRRKTITY